MWAGGEGEGRGGRGGEARDGDRREGDLDRERGDGELWVSGIGHGIPERVEIESERERADDADGNVRVGGVCDLHARENGARYGRDGMGVLQRLAARCVIDFKGAPRKHAQSGVHGEDDDGCRRQSGRHAVGALERDSQRRRHRVFARLILLGRRETVFELQWRHQRRHGCHRRSRVRDEWEAENRRRRRAQNGSREKNHSRRRARRRKTDSVTLFDRPSPLRASRIVKSRSKHSMPLITHIS